MLWERGEEEGKDDRIRSCGEILQRPRSSRRSNNPRRSIDCFSHSVEAQLATCSVGLHTCMTTLLHMTIVTQRTYVPRCKREVKAVVDYPSVIRVFITSSGTYSKVPTHCAQGDPDADHSPKCCVGAKVFCDDIILTMWLLSSVPWCGAPRSPQTEVGRVFRVAPRAPLKRNGFAVLMLIC